MSAKFAAPFDPGELTVHTTHGIGRYVGTRMMEGTDGTTAEYLQIDYSEGHRVFVPIEQVSRLSKYEGTETELARLSHTDAQRRTPYSRPPKPQQATP